MKIDYRLVEEAAKELYLRALKVLELLVETAVKYLAEAVRRHMFLLERSEACCAVDGAPRVLVESRDRAA